MGRKLENESIIGAEGLLNRSHLKGSPPSEVVTYFLSEEERLQLIEKYGPILGKRHRKMASSPSVEPQITKEQYLAYRDQGMGDKEILDLQLPGLHRARLLRLNTSSSV
ncbi:hypothetical protein [Brevibacillus sp. SAFN-007a]|uniref:hypothetical protein n=1 Tax=Brevibacillus sp. SAFN-007a TaxID=3436862 RepID=UPI003F7F3886